jgi:hypothetical protein
MLRVCMAISPVLRVEPRPALPERAKKKINKL